MANSWTTHGQRRVQRTRPTAVADTNGTFSFRFTLPRPGSTQHFWPYIEFLSGQYMIYWIKSELGISGVQTMESPWHHRATANETGTQIDLLIDRADDTINLCEMKFSEGVFNIDKRYADILRQKRDTFRRMTGTRKNLYITMVTTYGVADNAYAKELVACSVEAEALLVNAR